MLRRLKAAQAALTPSLQELREADDWQRFANVAIQEQLCARMEALRAGDDPEAIARERAGAAGAVARRRRCAARAGRRAVAPLQDGARRSVGRVEAHFASQAQERAENLAKKIVLCEQAEALAESSNWIQTAEAIKALQAEWKTIGPVSRGKEKAIWDRFRAACDRFFTRRHEDLAQRKTMWAENLAKKEALSVRAEALAESTDWDAAAAEIKRLQAEWKTIGPVKKSRSEAIWQRFRGACDAFFARYAQRHDTARAERVAAREATVRRARSDCRSAGARTPADLAARRARASCATAGSRRWPSRGVDPDRARARSTSDSPLRCSGSSSKWPAAFAGSELDPEANRKRMESLVSRDGEPCDIAISGPRPPPPTTTACRRPPASPRC